MNRSRYEELLDRLLEGDMTEPESVELAALLKQQPELIDDLRRHLVLWEHWSQHCFPERSADAFAESWKTRLAAEQEGDQFATTLRARLGSERRRRVLVWAAVAACLILLLTVSLLRIRPEPVRYQPARMITVSGDGVCVACILHEGRDHKAAIRVHEDGQTHIYYVSPKSLTDPVQNRLCQAPTPVIARGEVRQQGGRLALAAQSFELAK